MVTVHYIPTFFSLLFLATVSCSGTGGIDDRDVKPYICSNDYEECLSSIDSSCEINTTNPLESDLSCINSGLGNCWSEYEHCVTVCRLTRQVSPFVCRSKTWYKRIEEQRNYGG